MSLSLYICICVTRTFAKHQLVSLPAHVLLEHIPWCTTNRKTLLKRPLPFTREDMHRGDMSCEMLPTYFMMCQIKLTKKWLFLVSLGWKTLDGPRTTFLPFVS